MESWKESQDHKPLVSLRGLIFLDPSLVNPDMLGSVIGAAVGAAAWLFLMGFCDESLAVETHKPECQHLNNFGRHVIIDQVAGEMCSAKLMNWDEMG